MNEYLAFTSGLDATRRVAHSALPDAPVVAITGDGAFGFTAMEFDTAVRHNLPFVCIVGNDAAWGIEMHVQRKIYGESRLIGSTLSTARYDRVAEALGGVGFLVERPEQLRPALEAAWASRRPACVNVQIASIDSPMTENLIRRKLRAASPVETPI
jgi:acetolactate synthase-1/2/3 large subunit